jgi:hypothetical protein
MHGPPLEASHGRQPGRAGSQPRPATMHSRQPGRRPRPAAIQAAARGKKGLRLYTDRLECEEKKEEGKTVFSVVNTCILIKKRGEIHLMVWFARGQRFETYFCEVNVRNGKVAKRNV